MRRNPGSFQRTESGEPSSRRCGSDMLEAHLAKIHPPTCMLIGQQAETPAPGFDYFFVFSTIAGLCAHLLSMSTSSPPPH